jgi:hypothetical protein
MFMATYTIVICFKHLLNKLSVAIKNSSIFATYEAVPRFIKSYFG